MECKWKKRLIFLFKKIYKKKNPIGDPNQNPNKIRGKEKKMIMGGTLILLSKSGI